MIDRIDLQATMGREVEIECGCAVVQYAPRMIACGGRFVSGSEVAVVPCPLHVEIAREVAQTAGTADVDGLVEIMRERTA